MRSRTRLTTPPGTEPVEEAGPEAPGRPSGRGETYVPAWGLPAEPRVPMRHRGRWIALAVVVALVAVGWVALRVATAGSDFDPALDGVEVPTRPEPGDPTPLPGDEG